MESADAHRKNEHLSLASKQHRQELHNEFDQVQIIYDALPELAVDDVSTSLNQWGHEFTVPFYIEAMTGGSELALKVNRQLAQAARDTNLAMATGSGSILFKDLAAQKSFAVIREVNPDGYVIANLSASATIKQADEMIKLLNANALEIHINAVQETVMREGQRNFVWLENIRKIAEHVPIPVIVKEVGNGMSRRTIQKLATTSIAGINVSGVGGTNFAAIENRRNTAESFNYLTDFGISTPAALLEASQIATSSATIIASGGVRSPLDVIKAQMLGARLVGVARTFLKAIFDKQLDLTSLIHEWQEQYARLLNMLGVFNPDQLNQLDYVLHGKLLEFWNQRK